jgi:hypothetical protein
VTDGRGSEIPDPRPAFGRSVDEIDDDLRAAAVREGRQRELLLGSLTALDAIAARRERLLDERLEAQRREASATTSGR